MYRVPFISIVLPMSFTMFYLFGKQPNKPIKQASEDIETNISDVRVIYEDPAIKLKDSVDHLLEAMIQVESRGDSSAVGDTHLSAASIGVLQIRPIMVKEVNRILKKYDGSISYKLNDRFSKEKSIAMFQIWKAYYHNKSSLEKIARCWNGGPRGHKITATIGYWNKVKAYL
jgi:hypothetical protein|tara:strand:+ start:851 stop:1366 length:516 start_codon:yes stop_codon:yes gene_type:complete